MSLPLCPVMVLGLDGYPYSLLQQRMADNPDSIWHQLLRKGTLRRIHSTIPEVSSVAWASYLTGVSPDNHGLLGFVDRDPVTNRLYFPNGRHIHVPTLPERVHNAGGTTVSINFPATFPPKAVRGLIIGGFLGVRLQTNVTPASWYSRLQEANYVIDVNPRLAYEDKSSFLDELYKVLDARVRAAMMAESEFAYQLFQLHIMETDRLFHFFWGQSGFSVEFHRFLDRVDSIVARFQEMAERKQIPLVILSDHGFTRIETIFFINAFLRDQGYLRYHDPANPSYENISADSVAFALPPGRIFLTAGDGSSGIESGTRGNNVLREIADKLRALKNPVSGKKLFRAVVRREEIYQGRFTKKAARLFALPAEGVDIKADFNTTGWFQAEPGILVGTHTFDDALFYTDATELERQSPVTSVMEAGRFAANVLGLEQTTTETGRL